MEAEDPLSQLRDIHLPEPVTFWPPAPGWWVLLLLVLIGLLFLYRHAIAALTQRRKLAFVLRELDKALESFTESAAFEHKRNQAGLDYLADVNILLKRVVLVIFPASTAVHLTGADWLAFLDKEGKTTAFSEGAGRILGDGVYRRDFDADADALHNLAANWVSTVYQEQQAKTSSMRLPAFLKPGKEVGN